MLQRAVYPESRPCWVPPIVLYGAEGTWLCCWGLEGLSCYHLKNFLFRQITKGERTALDEYIQGETLAFNGFEMKPQRRYTELKWKSQKPRMYRYDTQGALLFSVLYNIFQWRKEKLNILHILQFEN